jgi:hypothetical protein
MVPYASFVVRQLLRKRVDVESLAMTSGIAFVIRIHADGQDGSTHVAVPWTDARNFEASVKLWSRKQTYVLDSALRPRQDASDADMISVIAHCIVATSEGYPGNIIHCRHISPRFDDGTEA